MTKAQARLVIALHMLVVSLIVLISLNAHAIQFAVVLS